MTAALSPLTNPHVNPTLEGVVRLKTAEGRFRVAEAEKVSLNTPPAVQNNSPAYIDERKCMLICALAMEIGDAIEQTPLEASYSRYEAFCKQLGIRPASFEHWKELERKLKISSPILA